MSNLLSQLRLVLAQLLYHRVPSCGSCGRGEGRKRMGDEIDKETRDHQQLLNVDEVPDVMKEPYIYTAYRPVDRPWGYYACSVFAVHNESGNVWSHGLGFFLVGCSLVNYLGQNWGDTLTWWPVLVFGVCSLVMLALSATAHLFHSKSRWHHFAFYLMDYMGVTIYAFGSGVCSMFVCSSLTFHEAFSDWFLATNVILSWFAFFACCMAKTKLLHNNSQRKVMMVAGVLCQAIVVSLPSASRIVECALQGSVSEAGHILGVFALLVTSAVTFAGHAPESVWPGRFDVWGHGHQWFHVIVVIAMLAQVRALNIDVSILGVASQLTRQPSPAQLVTSLIALVLLQAATLVYFLHQVVIPRLSVDIPREMVDRGLSHCAFKGRREGEGRGISSDHVNGQYATKSMHTSRPHGDKLSGGHIGLENTGGAKAAQDLPLGRETLPERREVLKIGGLCNTDDCKKLR